MISKLNSVDYESKKFILLVVGMIAITLIMFTFLENEGSYERNQEIVAQCNEKLQEAQSKLIACGQLPLWNQTFDVYNKSWFG